MNKTIKSLMIWKLPVVYIDFFCVLHKKKQKSKPKHQEITAQLYL